MRCFSPGTSSRPGPSGAGRTATADPAPAGAPHARHAPALIALDTEYKMVGPVTGAGWAGRFGGDEAMKRTQRRRFLAVAAVFALVVALAPTRPATADSITRVRGVVTDNHGTPMPKVKLWFDAVDIKKHVGPLTTSKDGKFVIAALDTSVAKKWKVSIDLPGYKTVKVHYEIVDSEKKERGSGDV